MEDSWSSTRTMLLHHLLHKTLCPLLPPSRMLQFEYLVFISVITNPQPYPDLKSSMLWVYQLQLLQIHRNITHRCLFLFLLKRLSMKFDSREMSIYSHFLSYLKYMNICLVSDFFFPNQGGVEVHMYQLAKQLLIRKNHVIIVTHQYGDIVGVRWLDPGIKVYYIPFFSFSFNTIIPTNLLTLPLAREILLREKIQLTHSHQSSSVLGIQFVSHSRLLGLATVNTEHSLFGFRDIGAINLAKVAQVNHFETDKIICVSRTTRENMIHRTGFPSNRFVVIPNAIHMSTKRVKSSLKCDRLILITIGRLFFRKGTDLLAQVIPTICKKYKNIEWWVVGDGPKKYLLEFTIQKFKLEDQVKLFGKVNHQKIQSILLKAHIFVNVSLTQSFGIAILQAASLGLLCVSTTVGAVQQILPQDCLILTQTNHDSIAEGISKAINIYEQGWMSNESINKMYDWKQLVDRTQQVYKQILQKPIPSNLQRIKVLVKNGRFSLILLLIVKLCGLFLLLLLDIFVKPRSKISKAIRIYAS